MKLFRLLLLLYPSSFRHEYGDDMVTLLRHQLRDENVARVAARTAVDLALTVPARHLEVHMSRTSTTALATTFVTVGAALAVVGGPGGVVAGLALLALAFVAWRRSRPVVDVADERWWKLLVAGVVLMGALVAVTSATGELPSAGWVVAMATGLGALGLIGAGIVLGIAGRVGTRPA